MASIIDDRIYRLNEAMLVTHSVSTGRTNACGSVKTAHADASVGGDDGNHLRSNEK